MKSKSAQRVRRERRRLSVESLETRNLMATAPIQITVENLSPDGGLAATPFWVSFHDGSFRTGAAGRSADEFAGLEQIAEEGDPSGLAARFAAASDGVDGVVTAPDGFPGAPVFEPGETVSQIIDVEAAERNRYFSFASMVIPSNDAFVANLDPREYRVFDSAGRFRGPFSIDVFGRDVWDAGTEVNNPQGGAAFSTEGGQSADEGGVIHRHPGLNDFVGTGLPTGEELDSAFISQTPLYRITLSLADRPSGPVDHRAPEAALQATDLVQGGSDHQIQVIYSDPSGVDASSIGANDLYIIGGGNGRVRVTDVTTDAAPGADPRTVVATYTVAPRDGSFDANDNGKYYVFLNHRSVSDTVGNRTYFSRLGSFSVNVGVNVQILVENLSPDGGLAETPFWVAFHNGSFEVGRSGQSAAQFGGLELIAEEGDPSALAGRFDAQSSGVDAVITAPQGFPALPFLNRESRPSG